MLRALTIEVLGFLQSVAVDRDRRVELVLIERDPREALQNQLSRSDPSLLHRRPHLRNRGLDDSERNPRGSGREQRCREQNQQRDDGKSFDADEF